MRRVLLFLALLTLAGCAQPASPGPDIQATSLPGAEAFLACPVVNGTLHACEPTDESPYLLQVRSAVTPGWTCLTFADDRFGTDLFGNVAYPFPDWYTYYGPLVGDGGPSGDMGVGILYDAKGDADTVAGALIVSSENESLVYTWEGPSRGFLQVPAPITRRDVRLFGVMHPVGETRGLLAGEDDVVPPGFHWEADPVVDHRTFWSQGPLDPSRGFSGTGTGGWRQWNLVHNVDVGTQTLHLPPTRNGTVAHGPSDGSGMAHWGWGRAAPFNTSLDLEGMRVRSTLQPYVEFYAEFHDLQDRNALLTSAFFCACPDPTITNWASDPVMAARCVAGLAMVEPPTSPRSGLAVTLLGTAGSGNAGTRGPAPT